MERYDSYKDSGVEWLGKIPTEWSTPFIKNLVEIKITDGPHLTPNFVDEGGIPFLSVESIQNSKIDLSRRRGNISVEDHLEYSKKCKPKWNDILLVKSGSVGKLTIVDIEDEFNVWSPLSLIRIKKKGNPKYFYYFFHTDYFQTLLKLNSGINTQPNIGMGVIENLKVVSPPLSEQQQIVSFLDTKTSLIDSLIEKTQLKIELLKEKRTSLINEVVTKGLNPNVEMKDSGVEWIGEIPSHWELTKMKFEVEIFGRIGFRGYTTEDIVNEGEGVITISPSNIKNDVFNLENRTYLSWEKYHESPEIKIFKDDIILVKTGSTIGKTSIIPDGVPEMTINPQLVVLKNVKLFPKFLYYQTTCKFIKESFDIEQTGSTTPTISQEKVNDFPLVKPPISEQQQIVEYLNEQTQKIDKTISIEEKRIELLKEYRQSLISEVVTGKRKVIE